MYKRQLIGFAPVEDPEIAVGVMLEEGENANYLMRRILDAYYSTHGKDSIYGIRETPSEDSKEEDDASSQQAENSTSEENSQTE